MSNVQDSRTTQQATYQRDLQHTPRQTPPAEKVIVVVHGVGDQSGNTTVQAVVNRVCAFHGEPGSVPLGRFPESAAFRIPSPWPSDLRQRFAFREVYWADVPRKLAQSNYPIEPPVRWGKSIVERLRLRARRLKSTEIKDDHFQLTEDVLSELIQALAVANKLVWVADRAGVGTVDLPKLLDDYLGDVQVVAEFEAQRATILGAFVAAMQEATTSNPGADVYVVAHSEGTVVAMLALLEAFRADEPQPWAMQVRGLMTIGSPIDKHLVLWPELFDGYQPARKPPRPIAWRNYYDYGDPIGFQLDEARRWIAKQGWSDVFDFKGDGHDFGFSRYALPGKAHVDYWTDDGVFGHFLSTVVLDKQPPAPVPKSLPGIAPLSYVLPYLVNFAVFCVAGFVLFKSMIGAIAPTDPAVDRLRNVALGAVGLGTLLSGITVASRLPRLTRSVWWGAFAMAFGVACAVAYRWTVWNLYLPDYIQHDKTIGGVLWLAIGVVTAAFLVSVFKPRLGISPLLWLGAIGIATSMAKHLYDASQHIDLGPIWPVVLGGLGAIYLWWLGALMFDLVFVWHLYIRRGRIMQKMMELQIH